LKAQNKLATLFNDLTKFNIWVVVYLQKKGCTKLIAQPFFTHLHR